MESITNHTGRKAKERNTEENERGGAEALCVLSGRDTKEDN